MDHRRSKVLRSSSVDKSGDIIILVFKMTSGICGLVSDVGRFCSSQRNLGLVRRYENSADHPFCSLSFYDGFE